MPGYSKQQQLSQSVKDKPEPKKKLAISQKPRRSIKKGKKTTEWETTRRTLNNRFYAVQIERCELNIPQHHNGIAIAYAHAKKRNELQPGELIRVAKSCQGCHEWIEYHVGKPEMQRIIDEAINKRPTAVNKILLAPIQSRT